MSNSKQKDDPIKKIAEMIVAEAVRLNEENNVLAEKIKNKILDDAEEVAKGNITALAKACAAIFAGYCTFNELPRKVMFELVEELYENSLKGCGKTKEPWAQKAPSSEEAKRAQEKLPTLRNTYMTPDCRIKGDIYGDIHHKDGTRIITDKIQIIETLDASYKLER